MRDMPDEVMQDGVCRLSYAVNETQRPVDGAVDPICYGV